MDSGGDARYWHVDVTDEHAVSNTIDEAAEWLGDGIDVLAHLAGILKGSGLEITRVDDSIWDPVIEVNLKGSYIVAKHVARHMIARRSGVIILTSSGAGVVGGSSSVAYGSSKGGTHGLAMTLDTHLSKHGIRVNDVLPGGLETPLKIGATEEHLVNTGDREAYEEHYVRAVLAGRRRGSHRVPGIVRRRLRSRQHQERSRILRVSPFGVVAQ